ncbi:MAG: hypothetical protein AAB254_04245, partial [candidate division NC10 bacterium]
MPGGRRERGAAPSFSRSPRVLILSASVGAGHLRAAQALEAAFAASDFPGEARHLDVLGFTNPAFRTLYSQGYIELVNKAPDLLGWLYDRLDVPWKSHRLQQAFEKINLSPFVRLLTALRPDFALCTHFLPAGIIAWLRRKGRLALPQALVVTDFDVHALWLLRDVEHYFVARKEARAYLEGAGVPGERISVTGIPVDPIFATPRNRASARRLHGLQDELPTILLSVGGFGLDGATKILECLLAVRFPLQVVAVAGARAEVQRRLQRTAAAAPPRHRVHVLGFTAAMDEKRRPIFCVYSPDLEDENGPLSPHVAGRLLRFARAAAAVLEMRGKNYLSVGGVSMGIIGSDVRRNLMQHYLGMGAVSYDMAGVKGRMDRGFYDHDELERAGRLYSYDVVGG